MSHRPRLRTVLVAGVALAGLAGLSACVPLVVGAAGVGGGYALGQERAPGDTAKDLAIRSEVSQSWAKYDFGLAHDVDATVYEGRVLLTGRVPSEDWRQEAVKRTWQVAGVKEVYDEIEVGPDTSVMQDTGDTWITSRLRAELVADADVRSINYSITTMSGIVYVIGSARDQAELTRVTDHARNIPNVRRVVSYVRIRPGEPVAAQPASTAAPAPTAATAARPVSDTSASTFTAPPVGHSIYVPPVAPTPRQSIEVAPLK